MQRRHRSRSFGWLVDLWVVLLAGLLCLPMLTTPGYGLARDLMFTPRQPLDVEAIGLGSSLPRAVPVDAVIGLASTLVDGAVVFRLAVLGVLVLAGWGAHRMLREQSLVARWSVATFAVWNPFVVERLGIGQWSLLAAYAAAWWLLPAVERWRRGNRSGLAATVWWTAVASITPTGGLVACLLVAWPRNVRGVDRVEARRWAVRTAPALLLQLPWLVPALVTAASSLSDPDAVGAFAARAERPGGAVLSLLGLGGVWARGGVPASRAGILGYVATALVLLVVVVGVRRLPPATRVLLPLSLVSLLLAAASSLPVLDVAVRAVVRDVPGGGLLRDAQKWLIPFVVLVGACLGAVVDRAVGLLRRRAPEAVVLLGLTVVLAPVALMVDAPVVTWRTLTPVTYPADFGRVDHALRAAPSAPGDLVTLPWQSYRIFAWGRDVSAADPAVRWFDVPAVVDDGLVVSGRRLAGEDRRARDLTPVVASGARLGRPLARAGIGWVLVYRDQAGAEAVDVSGLTPVYAGDDLALYRVPGPVTEATRPGRAVVLVVAGLDVLLLLLAAAAGFVSAAARVTMRRPSGNPPNHVRDDDPSASLRPN